MIFGQVPPSLAGADLRLCELDATANRALPVACHDGF